MMNNAFHFPRCLTIACSLSMISSAAAVTTFVSSTFDRSGWEAGLGTVTTETFDSDIAQSDNLTFSGGITAAAAGKQGSPNHLVTMGRFNTTLRPSASASDGYLTTTWTFTSPVTSFGADFFSIGGSRQVSVQGTFDSGLQAFDLRPLFQGDGGVDQGFFGLHSTAPFTSITLIALGTSTNDNFTVDNVSTAVPEPSTGAFAALIGLMGMGYRRRHR